MSSSCSGATTGGALTEMVALGASDIYLTACATITFFRFRYNKHTNFAMEAIEQPFQSQVAFGADVQVTLNRTGDLVYFMYVVIDLPGICACDPTNAYPGLGPMQFPFCDPCNPCGDEPEPDVCASLNPQSQTQSAQPADEDDLELLAAVDGAGATADIDSCTGLKTPWAHWVNAIGQFLIKRACIVIGGQIVDTLYNDYLYMWEELSGKPGKRLHEMVGKRFTRQMLVDDSKNDRRLYVPLPFWFTATSGNALPMVSLQFHGVQVHVCFEELRKCIQVSKAGLMVVKTRDRQPITNNDLNARIDCTYIYLDLEERDRFATGCFEQLITQLQAFSLTTKGSQVRMLLNFNHPIIELIWAVRRKCNEVCNNWFNYSGKWGKDPIRFVNLRLNNLPRFSGREGRYFRLVQPYQFHTAIPDSFIYCYSFALYPEEPQPSGSCNFSRIDNVEMVFDLQEALGSEEVVVQIFGRNWNVFRYREGLGGMAFAN